jgi:hypothetical protein
LFVGEGFGDFGWEMDLVAEVDGEIGEQGDAGIGSEVIASDQGLEGDGGFGSWDALAESCGEVREGAEGIESGAEEGVEVGSSEFRDADDDGTGGDVAEALATAVEEGGDPADEVEEGEEIDGAEQVAEEELTEAEFEAFGIDDAELEQAFADGLTVPEPFGEDAIEDGEEEDAELGEGLAEVGGDEGQAGEEGDEDDVAGDDEGEVDEVGEGAGEGAGDGEGEFDALRGADAEEVQGAGLVWVEEERPAKLRKRTRMPSSTRPKAILME